MLDKTTKKPLDFQRLKDLMMLARGGDPLAQAILKDIFEIKDIVQKSFLPTALNQQKQVFFDVCAKHFSMDPNYGEELKKPYESIRSSDAMGWQGYKGNLVERYVQMLEKKTDLSAVLVPGSQQQGSEKKHFWSKDKNAGEVLQE